ncbi:MAG: ATP-dependent zinc metalloprotease FtsH [Anaerolineae bacterium]|nr:ATP-dependent zinc metalloprotease FtsH [Anaerolineae bacterium]NIN96847.1 ATP-dependent zinc metalloprotease FtsH [Anaerolineae bacterium]NIQ79826.1 ATP-dependent zinc metalloprotease FtsH [Anaerolineae bacterium]
MYLIIVVIAVALFYNVYSASTGLAQVAITSVAEDIREGRISKIVVSGDELRITRTNGVEVVSRNLPGADLTEALTNLGVTQEMLNGIVIEVETPSEWGSWLAILSSFLPLILIGGLLLFMMRQAQTGNSQALSFGKSRARMFTGDQPTVTFDDVAGVAEAKQELEEVVEFLKEPAKFSALGARIPKGVLMVGPPGCGKTLMARAVAGEAEVPFFTISGSEFVEMFVGVGASRVRDLFDQAKRNSPCIVFVDEIDAVGRHRGAGLGGSHDEREQTLNQILVEMDGFDTDTNVIVMAATNRPDILDPALLRPGRFDRRVVLDLPDMNGRKAILDIHAKGKPLAEEVDLAVIAKQTPGFSGADIENLLNEAAILTARRDKNAVGMEELQEAVERVIAGPERKSRLISNEEKEIIAHHEAGHALVMNSLPGCDPVHKVSIVSRGMALGYTMPLPEDDRYLMQRSKFQDELAGLLGGRAAEELIFEDVTTGASNDLERATRLARKMVTEYGMSEKLGPLTFGHKEELVFLGKEIGEQRNYSEDVARTIDEEVRRLITEAHEKALRVLRENKDKLVGLAARLIEVETIEGPDLEAMFA